MTPDGCQGEDVQTDTCNEGQCPVWSDWSSWGDCSADCNGGIQSRSRQCENGADANDCAGSETDEQQCNRNACDPPMVYWKNSSGWSYDWRYVKPDRLPPGDTMLERCASYCFSFREGQNRCIVAEIWNIKHGATQTVYEDCAIATHLGPPWISPWKSMSWNGWSSTGSKLIVLKDFYESNRSSINYRKPDRIIGNVAEPKDLCSESNTDFGVVKYSSTGSFKFLATDDKNIIRESNKFNCAGRCFEKAGCSAFYVDDNGCTFVIGNAFGKVKNDDVTSSGMLNDGICPSKAFKNSFTRKSQFSCLFYTSDDADKIADTLVLNNAGNSNATLREWSFETGTGYPLVTSSQYINVEMQNLDGYYEKYRPVTFTIETHVRMGEDHHSRRRRSADDESDLIFVGEITLEKLIKIHRQVRKEAKKTSKQRQLLPRIDDIIADIEAFERKASSFILDGHLKLPENIKVTASGPIETLEFVQTAVDGSVSADCSSGACQCSARFIDKGNGCEEMTEEDAFLESVIDTVKSVFEKNRPDRPRTHLLKKWDRLYNQFAERYLKMTKNGCNFDKDLTNLSSIDFNSGDICMVSLG